MKVKLSMNDEASGILRRKQYIVTRLLIPKFHLTCHLYHGNLLNLEMTLVCNLGWGWSPEYPNYHRYVKTLRTVILLDHLSGRADPYRIIKSWGTGFCCTYHKEYLKIAKIRYHNRSQNIVTSFTNHNILSWVEDGVINWASSENKSWKDRTASYPVDYSTIRFWEDFTNWFCIKKTFSEFGISETLCYTVDHFCRGTPLLPRLGGPP